MKEPGEVRRHQLMWIHGQRPEEGTLTNLVNAALAMPMATGAQGDRVVERFPLAPWHRQPRLFRDRATNVRHFDGPCLAGCTRLLRQPVQVAFTERLHSLPSPCA